MKHLKIPIYGNAKKKEGVITMNDFFKRYANEARAEGSQQERQKLVLNAFHKGKTAEEISDFTDIPLNEVQEIIKDFETVL